ncbi:MAG: hypothetical protein ACP6IP_09145 [Candidatus Njordarchaeia archaeon]
MILESIWNKPALYVLREFLRAGEFALLSARELSRRTGFSTATIVDVCNMLIGLDILEKVRITDRRELFKLKEISTLKPYIEELFDVAEKFESYIEENVLDYIDEILDGEYYIGMYWAAMADIEPVDYNPNIFAIFTKREKRIQPLKFIDNMFVGAVENWEPILGKGVYIAVGRLDNYSDVHFGYVKDRKVRVTSIEKGIAQLFKWNVYPHYAATLALLQNVDMSRINEVKLLQIGTNLGVVGIIKAVAFVTEEILGEKKFEKLTKNVNYGSGKPDVIWGEKVDTIILVDGKKIGLDRRPINDAITTIYG